MDAGGFDFFLYLFGPIIECKRIRRKADDPTADDWELTVVYKCHSQIRCMNLVYHNTTISYSNPSCSFSL